MNSRDARMGGTIALLGCSFLTLVGCAAKLEHGQVTGIVRRGKQPLENVKVVFVPTDQRGEKIGRSEGITDAQGRFQLQNEDDDDGPVAGLYTVIVEDMALFTAPRSPDGTLLKRPPARIPDKYRSLLNSPLHKEIHAGSQEIDIDLP